MTQRTHTEAELKAAHSPDRKGKSSHSVKNCDFDLRGGDYLAIFETDDSYIGHIGEGDRLLIGKNGRLDMYDLMVMSRDAFNAKLAHAVSEALERAADFIEQEAAFMPRHMLSPAIREMAKEVKP